MSRSFTTKSGLSFVAILESIKNGDITTILFVGISLSILAFIVYKLVQKVK